MIVINDLEKWEMSSMNTKIIATGSYVSDTIISNEHFESILETSDEWITQRTGIKERRFESISNVHMATSAAKRALVNIDKETIDCIIVATYTPDSFIPTVANLVKENLDIKRNIPAFDINAACSGFIFALQNANALIKAKIYKRILVIGSDFNSRTLDYTDRSTSILFGDGAGAVVAEATLDVGIIDTILASETDYGQSLTLKSANDFKNPFFERSLNKKVKFSMKGSEVFKFAVKVISKSINEILYNNDLSIDEIDYVISHQANQRILNMAARSLKCDSDKFLSNVKDYGNTSSASVPILLDEANKNGLLKDKMKIIIVAFGGGLSYGASLLQW